MALHQPQALRPLILLKATLLLFSLVSLPICPLHQTENSDGLKTAGISNATHCWRSQIQLTIRNQGS